MPRHRMETVPGNCTGCLRCALACSALHSGVFNPSAARVSVVMEGAACTISFTEDCTGCGVCADNCLYGALLKRPGEGTP